MLYFVWNFVATSFTELSLSKAITLFEVSSNILSKATGSTNAINVVKAVESGLKQLKDPLAVAHQRGISLKELFE